MIEKVLNKSIFGLLLCVISASAQNLRNEWDTEYRMKIGGGEDPGASVIGFAIGPILFFLSFALIWLN